MKKMCMRRHEGSVGNLMITGICILAMTVIMLAYLDNARLLQQKVEVGQLARKYILKMETVGCLSAEDITFLTQELGNAGVTDIDLSGTTINEVSYGHTITLKIQGKLGGEHAFMEKRVSTAKN